MTKLTEWLAAFGLFVFVWYSLFTGKIQTSLTQSEIIAAPFVVVGIIGIIVLSLLIRRIATFNDCPEAAVELRNQIKQAKQDLTLKGFNFN